MGARYNRNNEDVNCLRVFADMESNMGPERINEQLSKLSPGSCLGILEWKNLCSKKRTGMKSGENL